MGRLHLAFFLLSTAATSGCASYVNHLCHNISPASAFVNIESTPPGAIAKLSSGRTVRTPARVPLRNEKEITATFTKDGYQPATVKIWPGVNAWLLGDFLMLPPFGFLIDLEQGATATMYPGTVHVTLASAAAEKAVAPNPNR